MFSDYSELTNKNRKEKVYKKNLAADLNEVCRGVTVARAITIDHATELNDMI